MSSWLIEASDSIFLVIDVQREFLRKIPAGRRSTILGRIRGLVGAARELAVPLIVTVETPRASGPVAPAVRRALPPGHPVHDKRAFGVAGNPPILAGLQKTGRKTAILTGFETDVCIQQSALGLLDKGYRVAVVTDAVGAPAADHAAGLERLRQAGVVLTAAKGLFYEWIRTVDALRRLKNPLGKV